MAVFDRVNALKVTMSRKKRRFWCFNNEREWLTIAVPVCAFKRVFQNFCLLGCTVNISAQDTYKHAQPEAEKRNFVYESFAHNESCTRKKKEQIHVPTYSG